MPAVDTKIIDYLLKQSRASKSSMMLLWVLLMTPILAVEPGSPFVWINAAVMLVYDMISLYYRRRPSAFYEDKSRKAMKIFIILSLSYAVYWGVMIAYILSQPDYESVYFSAALVLAFSTVGGFMIWLMNEKAGKLYLCLLFAPTLFTLTFEGSLSSFFSALFVLTCLTQLIIQGNIRAEFLIEMLASQVESEEEADRYKEISHKDSLTDLHNRRYFDRHFFRMYEEAGQKKDSISLLVCDIDLFKKINDQYGHDAGDTCLVHAAKLIKQEVRTPTDILCRYGGEEFVVILKGAGVQATIAVAERICQAFRDTPVWHKEHEIQMTISIGGATGTGGELSPEDFFTVADQALYEAKTAGRDRHSLHFLH